MSACLDHDVVDTGVQLTEDVATIDAYILEHGLNAYKDKSGIRFVIDELGKDGVPPRGDQTIKAKYTGKFLDGTVFDDGGDGADGPLGSFIGGWQYCLSIWPQGTKGKLFVPSPLGFGAKTVNNVPANSILMFDIDFTEVTLSNAEKARLTSDVQTIDDWLEENEIDAVKDSTGVRYVITSPGGGAVPGLYTRVKFSAVGKAFSTGNQFFTGTSEPTNVFDSRPADYIGGLKVALTHLPEGGKMTVYIPSGLAFGPFDNTQINLPANTIVVYEIELLEIYDN